MGPDFDISSSPILQTLQNGKDIVVAGSKSGIVYGFDPDARGKVLWSVRVGQGGTGIGVGRGRSVGGHRALLLFDGNIMREAQN